MPTAINPESDAPAASLAAGGEALSRARAKAVDARGASTREQLVRHAQTLIRKRGCNGFSYRDLAEEIGVKTASIHYHFPVKDDLLFEALEDYLARTIEVLQEIEGMTADPRERLLIYSARVSGAQDGQVCLCGMLSADFASLSERLRHSLQRMYGVHERWLAGVIEAGTRLGTLRGSADPQADGRWLYSALQGALLSSRLFGSFSRVRDVVNAMLVEPLAPGDPAGPVDRPQ